MVRPLSMLVPALSPRGMRGLATTSLAAAAAGTARAPLPRIRWAYSPYPVPYELGLRMQEYLVQERADARSVLRAVPPSSSEAAEAQHRSQRDTLLLLQHTPVYTEGRRRGAYAQTPDEVAALTERFNGIGADYVQTLRGGLITFHGPGQLVGYPVLDLGAMGLSAKCYVEYIQRIFRRVMADRGLRTVNPPEDHTGVWADENHKITSIGIRVRHRITSHGFAFNVEQAVLPWFGYIVACGIRGKSMTCLQREILLRNRPPQPVAHVDTPTPLPGTSPNVGLTESPLPLDAEAAAVTVRSVLPEVLREFGVIFNRQIEPDPTPDLVFEPDEKGILRRVVVDGHVIE